MVYIPFQANKVYYIIMVYCRCVSHSKYKAFLDTVRCRILKRKTENKITLIMWTLCAPFVRSFIHPFGTHNVSSVGWNFVFFSSFRKENHHINFFYYEHAVSCCCCCWFTVIYPNTINK